jgi:hypothetical protein
VRQDLVVVKVDRARQLLAEAKDVGDAKRVADVVRAAEVYAKRQKLSREVISYATAVKVDAMTLMGEFIRSAPKRGPQHSKGGGSKGSKRELLPAAPPTLADLGIDKKLRCVDQSTVSHWKAICELLDAFDGKHDLNHRSPAPTGACKRWPLRPGPSATTSPTGTRTPGPSGSDTCAARPSCSGGAVAKRRLMPGARSQRRSAARRGRTDARYHPSS